MVSARGTILPPVATYTAAMAQEYDGMPASGNLTSSKDKK